MKCPNCDAELSAQHLRESEPCATVARSICATYSVSKRKRAVAGPGRRLGSKNKLKA